MGGDYGRGIGDAFVGLAAVAVGGGIAVCAACVAAVAALMGAPPAWFAGIVGTGLLLGIGGAVWVCKKAA